MSLDKTITAYKVNESTKIKIVPSSREREWMDNTKEKFAYRCLPLIIANMHGWAVYSEEDTIALWNGEPYQNSVILKKGNSTQTQFWNNLTDSRIAVSHFGSGIITFHINHLIKTPPGYNLYISGSPNHYIEGAVPLTGIYEADWGPYSFTMNWKITTPNKFVFFKKEIPICFFFPVQRNLIEEFNLEIKNVEENEELDKQYKIFSKSRRDFNNKLSEGNNDDLWQKNYFQGKMPDGSGCPVHDHKTKLKLNTIEV